MDEPLDSRVSRNFEGGPAFALSNRIYRAAWSLGWALLAAWTPPPLHGWRIAVLRLFGATVGRNCRAYGSTRVWSPRNLTLGDNVFLGRETIVYNQGRIAIGSDSVVSQRAHLCASSHRVDDPYFQLVLRPIVIGARCWIAAEAFVGPGVTVHDRAVIAARAALFEDAAADGIYRGNPAAFWKARSLSSDESPLEA